MRRVYKFRDADTNTRTSCKFDDFYSPSVKIEKKQVSIYLDEDVIKAIDKWVDSLPKKEQKGARSDLFNNFAKKVFNIRQGDNEVIR